MRGGYAVRGARIVDVFRTLYEPCRFPSGVFHRHDLIVFAVQDESGHVDLLQIFGKVGLRECFDTVVGVLESALHAPEPELIQDRLRDSRSCSVRTIELTSKILVELRAVFGETGAD